MQRYEINTEEGDGFRKKYEINRDAATCSDGNTPFFLLVHSSTTIFFIIFLLKTTLK
ncbi:hypothetical protein HMPREF0658_1960 [Hoylesella marshii DSM 16973 = JCM 13450]|uniref:Uncharacterized protein n=1 Tax=Hoylesella marshii DSM 16973 = JCM 13450 TaxID=862515 RepID=E0NUV5_9BACT|nr:hypothetical protein HMPREF0658_1960 [Hoylesella marshii DSM 16973 = JCM 13450]